MVRLVGVGVDFLATSSLPSEDGAINMIPMPKQPKIAKRRYIVIVRSFVSIIDFNTPSVSSETVREIVSEGEDCLPSNKFTDWMVEATMLGGIIALVAF